jgi:hypothetical protein
MREGMGAIEREEEAFWMLEGEDSRGKMVSEEVNYIHHHQK